MNNVAEYFNNHVDDEYLEFNRVEEKLSTLKEIHAFLLLDKIFPGNTSLFLGADQDVAFLNFDEDSISSLSEQQVVELLRCGVMLDENSSLFIYL